MTSHVTTRINGEVPETSADDVVRSLPTDATIMVSGFGSVGYPKEVPLAIAESDREFALTLLSGGGVGGEIDIEMVEAGAIARRHPGQGQKTIRDAINTGRIAFADRHYGGFSDDVQFGSWPGEQIAIIEAVAVGEDWVIPTTSIGHSPVFVERADRIIVEVNDAQPLALQHLHDIYRPNPPPERDPIPLREPHGRIGSNRIAFHPDKLDAVIRTDTPDTAYTIREPTPTDTTIAQNLIEFIATEMDRTSVTADTLNFEFGVGNVGNALVTNLTELELDHRDVAFYSELVQDGILDLLDLDHFTGASATALALSNDGLDDLFANIDRYRDKLVVRPTDITNNPALINRFGVIAVNSALEADIYGNVNSTHINGSHLMNAIGGSNDFCRHGYIGIFAFSSRIESKDISRIVPMVPHVDHTEHDVDVIVTEQGVADLRGCTPVERAERVIANCAHPAYRDDLQSYLENAQSAGGHIPFDFSAAANWNG